MSDSDQLRCSICLDAFTSPASVPCGHRFCLACIGEYWRLRGGAWQCPLCRASFPARPQLAASAEPAPDAAGAPPPPRPGEVPCDLCPALGAGRRAAVSSCLACLASYCRAHLEPHYRDEALGRHPLVTAWKNLEGPVCRIHGGRLDRFCRSDQTCVCPTCARTDHRGHRLVSVDKEAERKKVKLKRSLAKFHQTIQDRQKKAEDIRQSLRLVDAGAERDAARGRAAGLVADLEQEIAELQRRSGELERLSRTDDHLYLLQRFPAYSLPPHNRDWSHAIKSLLQELREKLEIT